MPEFRDCQLLANVEPTVMAEVQKVIKLEGVTASNYVRSLIIKDLSDRGNLTQEKLVRMATTDSVAQMKKRIQDSAVAANGASA